MDEVGFMVSEIRAVNFSFRVIGMFGTWWWSFRSLLMMVVKFCDLVHLTLTRNVGPFLLPISYDGGFADSRAFGIVVVHHYPDSSTILTANEKISSQSGTTIWCSYD